MYSHRKQNESDQSIFHNTIVLTLYINKKIYKHETIISY